MASQIYIVEDHDIMRATLVEFVNEAPDMRVSGSAASAEEALTGLWDTQADLILIDMALPGMSGAELVARLMQNSPQTVCLMYSAHSEPGYVKRAMDAGARGYVLKGAPAELTEAMRRVLAGDASLGGGSWYD